MNCDNQCCENHHHHHHEYNGGEYGINVNTLVHTNELLLVEQAAELVPVDRRKPGTKITFWTYSGWETWQFVSKDVREWPLREAWKQQSVYGMDNIKDLQNQIDSIQIGGWAISQEFGDDEHIGISQKKLTEEFNNVARLDNDGKVPPYQLPSYVDDVINGYFYNNAFYADENHTQLLEAETGKIYVDLPSKVSYRYSGSAYVAISNPYFPDEEDLTVSNDIIKFKDKAYSAASYSGLGRKYLRKNMVNGVNTLTQAMVSAANTIYVIQYDYDLNGESITIPDTCVLEFDGGSIGNGTLNLNGCTIIESPNALLCDCVGSITNAYLYSTTFGEAGKYNDNNTLQRALDLMLSYNYKLLLRGTYNTTDTLNYVEHTVEKAGINIEGSDVQQDGIVYSGNDAALRISQSYVAGASNFKFFRGGKIANISITNTSASTSVIEISSWWQGGIDNVTIEGNGVTRYGIYTPSVDAVKSPFSNPDPYATASLDLQRVRIFNCTDYGIYNANPNGDPYWSLKYCQIENNGSGIQLNSSGWSIEEGSLSYNDNYSIIFGDLEISGNQPNEFYGQGIEFDGSGNAAILFNACSNAIFELCRFVYRKIGDKLCQRNVSEIAGVSRGVINNVFRYCLFTSDGNAPAVDSIYIFNILTNNLNNNIAYNQVEGGNIRATTYNPESVFKLSNVITFYRYNSIDYRMKKQSEDKFYWAFKPKQVVLNEFTTLTTVQLIQMTNNRYVSYFDATNNILTIPSTGFYKVHMYIDFTTNSENTRLQVNANRNSVVIFNNHTNIIKSEEYTLTSKALHANAFACLLLNEGDTLSFTYAIQAIGAAAMNDGITIRQDLSYIMVEKVV